LEKNDGIHTGISVARFILSLVSLLRRPKMRRTVSLAAIATAMFLGVSAAHAQVLMYSFETGDSPNSRDGFVPNGITPVQTTTGATVGTGALECISPGGYQGTYTETVVPPLSTNDPALAGYLIDVTITPSNPAPVGTYADLGLGLFISNPGEAEYGDQYIAPTSDWINIDLAPGTYTNLFVPAAGDNPDTGLPDTFSDLVSDGWVVTGFNLVDDSGAAQTFYVDNIRAVVPEPASIGIGAVGGLMLLARRRRKA
jgi:hypothetical protein